MRKGKEGEDCRVGGSGFVAVYLPSAATIAITMLLGGDRWIGSIQGP